MYKVSILTPIFKAEKYIERCARSLFGQTYANLEFVFVDDCTPDKSMTILSNVLEGYPERKGQVKVIHNAHNRGAAGSKNIAIENATGEFVCFVDADDWMELDAIRLLVNQQVETEADVVWGRMVAHSKTGVAGMEEPGFIGKQDLLLRYISEEDGGAVSANWRRIIRKSVIDLHNLRMVEGFNYSEDRLLMTKIVYYSNTFSMIDDIVYHYNKENESSLTGMSDEMKDHVDIFNQVMGNFQFIEDFFADKEPDYYKEASKAKLRLLVKSMDTALRVSSKERFQAAANRIKSSNPAFLYLVGWDRSKVWQWLHGNYYYRKLLPQIKKFFT